ncbi:MAG TPA: hypothetical protein VFA59_19620 [Vicinamibacterales bacterium]|nr:hypothetical protein [Vicinamibacterales bacterium]
MDRERAGRFRRVFDAHDDAIRALREANSAIREANAAMDEAIGAHDLAIQAALAANQAAIDLLNDMTSDDRR